MLAKSTYAFAFLLISALLLPAQSVPPPPKPADSGPTLEATVKYIQDKLNSQGRVNWMFWYVNTQPPGASPWAGSSSDAIPESEEVADATTDLNQCTLHVRFKITYKEQAKSDQDASFSFKEVKKLEVMTLQEEYQRNRVLPPGNPNIRVEVSPAISVLVLSFVNKPVRFDFKFLDADMANRMAKAMLHGVELCGGGDNDPFK
jgi:hypothetical protein